MAKNKTNYVDGFVLVVKKKNVTAYRKMATEAAKMWMKYGALSYKECMLDDPKPKFITLFFTKLIKAKPNETVWYSYIEYKSKKHRDEVNRKVMAKMEEYSKKHKDMPMPFDMKRVAYGGFKVVVNGQ